MFIIFIFIDIHSKKIQWFKTYSTIQYSWNLSYVSGSVLSTGNVARNNVDSLFLRSLIQWGIIANDDPCYEGNNSSEWCGIEEGCVSLDLVVMEALWGGDIWTEIGVRRRTQPLWWEGIGSRWAKERSGQREQSMQRTWHFQGVDRRSQRGWYTAM